MAAARILHNLVVLLVAVVASTTVSAQPNGNNTSPPPPPLGDSALPVLPQVPFLNTTKIKVCTTPWTPAVVCSNATDPVEWTGFEIEVFKLTASRMGIVEDMIGTFFAT
jgi:ABC-type amino acid transport substrate-binding protein